MKFSLIKYLKLQVSIFFLSHRSVISMARFSQDFLETALLQIASLSRHIPFLRSLQNIFRLLKKHTELKIFILSPFSTILFYLFFPVYGQIAHWSEALACRRTLTRSGGGSRLQLHPIPKSCRLRTEKLGPRTVGLAIY